MPLADFNVPFYLRSKVWTNNYYPGATHDDPLALNATVTLPGGNQGIYLLKNEACQLTNQVRSTKDFVPQGPGALLHRRWVGGMEMALVIQFWETVDKIACDATLQEMLDTLMGYLYGLLNAGDNEGRISWVPDGQAQRMLDDIRLLTYPVSSQSPGGPFELAFTVDTKYSYAENETQLLTNISDGATTVVTNYGNVPTFPVIQFNMVNGVPVAAPCTGFAIENAQTDQRFIWTGASQPGSMNIPANDYGEIDCWENTVYLNGDEDNLTPGIDMTQSEYLMLLPGPNWLTVVGAPCDVLVNAAWG